MYKKGLLELYSNMIILYSFQPDITSNNLVTILKQY